MNALGLNMGRFDCARAIGALNGGENAVAGQLGGKATVLCVRNLFGMGHSSRFGVGA